MGLENIQHNLVIKMPRLGLSFEVNATPVKNNTNYVTYSLSSSKDKQVSFRHSSFVEGYSEGSELIYDGDSVITNGSWMQETKMGARIC